MLLFDVYTNALTGALPTEIGLLTGLVNLDSSANNFDGTIPTELALLSDLQYLNISLIQLTGTVLSYLDNGMICVGVCVAATVLILIWMLFLL